MTFRIVARATSNAALMSRRSSLRRITWPVSLATSVPEPMAMPRSARARAGASLMPSPTIATRRPSAWRRSTSATFWSGNTSASTRSIPTWRAIASAVRRLSPVRIAVSSPIRLSAATASRAWGFSVSAQATRPASAPSTATSIAVLPSDSSAWSRPSSPAVSSPRRAMSRRVPSRIFRPRQSASTPWPGMAWKESGRATSRPRSRAARTMASPSGCSEATSATAAQRSTSSGGNPSEGRTSVTDGSPRVSVPVLSRTTVSIFVAASMASAPLNSTPCSAPLPVPAIIALGVAMPTAQGQEMTSTVMDRSSANPNTPISPSTPGDRMKEDAGSKKSRYPARNQKTKTVSASAWTPRMKWPATQSASFWIGALEACASSTSRMIWARAVSLPTWVARKLNAPVLFSVPLITAAPACFSTGRLSPVSIDSSTAE